MRQAAGMLIIKDGMILGVSRKNDPTKFGLPGGKCDGFEAPWQAAIREVKEETDIDAGDLIVVYKRTEPAHAPAPEGEDFEAYCFYPLEWRGEPKSMEEGTVVKWLTAAELTSPESGAFAEYNKIALAEFRKMYPFVELKSEK